MQNYFALPGTGQLADTPAELTAWLAATVEARRAGQDHPPLNVIQGAQRLIFSAADVNNQEQWMVVLREESDAAQVQALVALFKLTMREAEVLHWVIKGKTNRDIGDILGTSPRTVNKHLEHVFEKLGVETRTAAASLAMNKLRGSAEAGAMAASA